MRNNRLNWIIFAVLFLFVTDAIAQNIGRGSYAFSKVGVHRGNRVRTVFSNLGFLCQPGTQGPQGAWKFDTNGYVGDISPLIGVLLPIEDYTDDGVADTLHSVVITNVSRPGGGDNSPGGEPWTFQPIPGFASDEDLGEGKGVAMSHQPETWPNFWPDHPDWVDEDGNPEWNGYFGRGQLNADQESYFWMDDNLDQKMFDRYGFLPDSTDPTRKGQALQVKVRGLQWSNFIAQDVIFWLYEITNVGTTTYDQTVFGFLVGTYVGLGDPEYNDDVSFFDIRESITYTWDFDDYISPSANPRWQPTPSDVGYVGYAFLESPGNQYDGIDNDADNRDFSNSANYFEEVDFEPRTLRAGDKLILISNDNTFTRSEFTMPAQETTVTSLGKEYTLIPDETVLVEGDFDEVNSVLNPNAFDGFDNDLDGLIDENFQVHYRQYQQDGTGTVLIDTLNPVQYVDYIGNIGMNDPMIDEARNDEIDNDGDWNPEFDDNGQDGKPNTGDFGEGDGFPTPGEPNFDATDVDESDQIGLTSFQYFVPAGDIALSDEEDMWRRMRPGFFDVPSIFVGNVAIRGEDGDFIYSSGYFPLLPETTERFSLALAYGDDFDGVIKTKKVAQDIFDANYNFPRPPEKPTLTAVGADGKVVLYWDKVAEASIDPTTKEKDFEGYKIYKGTDPDFTDAKTISDGQGNARAIEPIEQFDLANGIRGYFQNSAIVNDILDGLPFYLGSDTGLKNTYVDTDVINGRTYYYAVVAYDRGVSDKDIYPSENSVFVAKDNTGAIQVDINTAAVVPSAPVAGYVPPEDGETLTRVEGYSETVPYYQVVDESNVKTAEYEVVFIDSSVSGTDIAYAYNVVNVTEGDTLFSKPPELEPNNNLVFDGVNLSFNTNYQTLDSIVVNTKKTGWGERADSTYLRTSIAKLDYSNVPPAVRDPRDYQFVFYDEYNIPSVGNMLGLPLGSVTSNFQIFDVSDPDNPFTVPFANASRDSVLNNRDRIILANQDTTDITWSISFLGEADATVPSAGDTLYISIRKPFTEADKFTFTTQSFGFDGALAKANIDDVRAVPNPYVVTNVFEQPLPPQIRGRGERIINFINLPPSCKVHIYTASGNHVRTLEHEGTLLDGTVTWDLRTKEGLDVAFGVYFYVVEADNIGEKKFGKLAIIK